MLKPLRCSNPRCRKQLDITDRCIINLTIIMQSTTGISLPPQTGRMYCNQECYEETIANVNTNAPALEQIEILANTKIKDNPITYLVVCRPRYDFVIR